MHFARVIQVPIFSMVVTDMDLVKMGLALFRSLDLALVTLNATEIHASTAYVGMETVIIVLQTPVTIVHQIFAHIVNQSIKMPRLRVMAPAPQSLWVAAVLQDFNVQLTFA
jgi:hypothetical protein